MAKKKAELLEEKEINTSEIEEKDIFEVEVEDEDESEENDEEVLFDDEEEEESIIETITKKKTRKEIEIPDDESDEIKELLKYTDLVLLDIKHINNEKCIDLTGAPNKHTLEFAKYLSNLNIPVWIRQVLIPGYTDDKFDLLELKKFINSLTNVEKVELLPYHNLGKYKFIIL